ncbi:hypothetical protein ACOSP7_032814 [Xanthoceras sorbifolium]
MVREVLRIGGKVSNMEDLSRSLGSCSAQLEVWSKNRFGSLRKRIDAKQQEVDELFLKSHEKRVMGQIRKERKGT